MAFKKPDFAEEAGKVAKAAIVRYCHFHPAEKAITRNVGGMPLCRTCFDSNEDRPEYNRAIATVKAERERLGLSAQEYFERQASKHSVFKEVGARDWAEILIARHEAGHKQSSFALKLAKAATHREEA